MHTEFRKGTKVPFEGLNILNPKCIFFCMSKKFLGFFQMVSWSNLNFTALMI